MLRSAKRVSKHDGHLPGRSSFEARFRSHLRMTVEEPDIILSPSLRAKRSNPYRGITDSWIASSLALLAMTISANA
jgi:hypothetical protein